MRCIRRMRTWCDSLCSMIPDIESICFFPIPELCSVKGEIIMSPTVGMEMRSIKPFTAKFISCIFLYEPSIVTDIPRAVILLILFPVRNISSFPYSHRCLPFTNFTILLFKVYDCAFSVLIASAHKTPPCVMIFKKALNKSVMQYFGGSKKAICGAVPHAPCTDL